MPTHHSPARRARSLFAACAVLGALLVQPAGAAKPEWAGNGKEGKDAKELREHPNGKGRDAGPSGGLSVSGGGVTIQLGGYFGDRQREAVRIVFGQQMAQGSCPPGLAKKNNGCRPPGQTKAWKLGQPLPGGVITYPIPRDLQRRLGEPPPGYKFVRVAADILLIAVGTAMVVDAIEDLAGL